MESSKARIKRYLPYITDGWIVDNDMPADELSEYDSYIQNMENLAANFGDLDALKQFFEHILTHPGINTEELAGSHFTWSNEQVREIITYVYQKVWTK